MHAHRDRDSHTSHSSANALHSSLLRCGSGEIPPNVTLAQLFMRARNAEEARNAISAVLDSVACERGGIGESRIREVQALWARAPQLFQSVREMIAIENAPQGAERSGVEHWASVFDRACALSPEMSVALYSLGDTKLLNDATEEIAAWIEAGGLLGRDKMVLDIGCGIGRLLLALARRSRAIVGTEISAQMAAEARKRCAGTAEAAVIRMSGRDLACFADSSFDIVIALDVFPYLVRCGRDLVVSHFTEGRRVLKPGGAFLIFNYSYSGDAAADRNEVSLQAANAGFAILRNGTRDFNHWDGLAFHLQAEQRRPR
jgi:ubiquinone/menaquinone biosynthesis C-methylase UbiE